MVKTSHCLEQTTSWHFSIRDNNMYFCFPLFSCACVVLGTDRLLMSSWHGCYFSTSLSSPSLFLLWDLYTSLLPSVVHLVPIQLILSLVLFWFYGVFHPACSSIVSSSLTSPLPACNQTSYDSLLDRWLGYGSSSLSLSPRHHHLLYLSLGSDRNGTWDGLVGTGWVLGSSSLLPHPFSV